MPCYDPGLYKGSDTDHVERKLARTEAMLCAVMRGLDRAGLLRNIIDGHNSGEAGVTREEIVAWYNEHLARDVKR